VNVIEVTWGMVMCPKCYAQPGVPCSCPHNPHLERIKAAADLFRYENRVAIRELTPSIVAYERASRAA
jgi:hypothetical protein